MVGCRSGGLLESADGITVTPAMTVRNMRMESVECGTRTVFIFISRVIFSCVQRATFHKVGLYLYQVGLYILNPRSIYGHLINHSRAVDLHNNRLDVLLCGFAGTLFSMRVISSCILTFFACHIARLGAVGNKKVAAANLITFIQ
jgi:hypothetical protein